jgi:integrase
MLSALLGPRPPVGKRRMLTREELHLLLLNAKMRRRNPLTIRIQLATGVRGSELFAAKWADVHLDEALDSVKQRVRSH